MVPEAYLLSIEGGYGPCPTHGAEYYRADERVDVLTLDTDGSLVIKSTVCCEEPVVLRGQAALMLLTGVIRIKERMSEERGRRELILEAHDVLSERQWKRLHSLL